MIKNHIDGRWILAFCRLAGVQAAIAPGLPTGTFNVDVGTTFTLDFIKWTATGSTDCFPIPNCPTVQGHGFIGFQFAAARAEAPRQSG